MRALTLWLLAILCAGAGWAQSSVQIKGARYEGPTTRYPHGVLGDQVEHTTLRVTLSTGGQVTLRWPRPVVFEDTAPRIVDVTGDGVPEVIVVESHESQGARLAVYGLDDGALRLRAASPFIGQRFRWLAPVGAMDLDGDGQVEIAWVDRPHLAKTLRVWRFVTTDEGGQLTEVAQMPGVTNHRIGERDIAGGIRTCAGSPELIVADASWSRLLAIRLSGGRLQATDVGPHRGRDSFAAALLCGS